MERVVYSPVRLLRLLSAPALWILGGMSGSTAQADIPRAAAAALGQNMQVFALTVGEIVNETGVCQLVTGLASGYSYEAVDRRVHRLAHYTDLASRVVMQSLAKKLVKA